MRKAATLGGNDGTTFGYMALCGLLLVPVAFIIMGGFPGGAPWQAPTLTFGTQLLNAVGALFLVMALSRGKTSIVAPTTNTLAPVLTVLISLAVYQTLPSIYGALGIVLQGGVGRNGCSRSIGRAHRLTDAVGSLPRTRGYKIALGSS